MHQTFNYYSGLGHAVYHTKHDRRKTRQKPDWDNVWMSTGYNKGVIWSHKCHIISKGGVLWLITLNLISYVMTLSHILSLPNLSSTHTIEPKDRKLNHNGNNYTLLPIKSGMFYLFFPSYFPPSYDLIYSFVYLYAKYQVIFINYYIGLHFYNFFTLSFFFQWKSTESNF